MRDNIPNVLTLLLAILLLLTAGGVQSWIVPVPFAFGREEVKKPEAQKDARMEAPAPTSGTNIGPSNMPYTGLAEKNIFSPERKEFPIFSTPELVKKPQVRPQLVLYGVTLAGDYQSASLVQSGRAVRKGEREMLTLKVGEQIGEYRLTKIMPDRIVLEGEGDSFEVLLNDPSKPKQRTVVKTETQPATVTSTLTSPPVSPSVQPPRPGVPGTPSTPTVPTGPTVPRPEAQRPMPSSAVPQPVPPGTMTTPPPMTPNTPTTPSTSPTFVPRRGRMVPTTPGIPNPQPPGQPQGQGGP